MRLPLALRIRLLRRMAPSTVREFPWALALAAGVALALAAWLGALGGWLGVVAVAVVALAMIALVRLAWQAFASARSVREALAELEPPADARRSRSPVATSWSRR